MLSCDAFNNPAPLLRFQHRAAEPVFPYQQDDRIRPEPLPFYAQDFIAVVQVEIYLCVRKMPA
jgi:hypothetical protein